MSPARSGTTGQFLPHQPQDDLVPWLTERIRVMPNGCWEWTGSRNGEGYGVVAHGPRDTFRERAHRVIYTLAIGPIPDGLVIDHVCMNPPCVNPAHLEAVTHGENLRRGWAAHAPYLATGCKRGHPWTEENTYRRANGWRICRVCHREGEARRKLLRPKRRPPTGPVVK